MKLWRHSVKIRNAFKKANKSGIVEMSSRINRQF